jgi:hypothetical protein
LLRSQFSSPLSPVIRVTRETHTASASIQPRVASAGWSNRFGEPNFRVVWGGSRLGWIGGRWTDRDAHGNIVRETIGLRRVPKYLPLDRWHIASQQPPSEARHARHYQHGASRRRGQRYSRAAERFVSPRSSPTHC